MPLDDPTLALIARFVVHDAELQELHNEEYLRVQLASIRRHIKAFPPEQQEQAAFDWIEQYASDEFEQAAEWLRTELNRLVEQAAARVSKRQEVRDLPVVLGPRPEAHWPPARTNAQIYPPDRYPPSENQTTGPRHPPGPRLHKSPTAHTRP